MPIINNNKDNTISPLNKKTVGFTRQKLEEVDKYIYSPEDMKFFRMDEAIKNHPLARKPLNMRSKWAYAEIMRELKPTTKYLLPGQICVFEYIDPKTRDQLEYWDKTPMTLFCGLTKTADNNIREVGFNIHFIPPFARARMLNTVYEVFKRHFWQNFNEAQHKPFPMINYKALSRLCKRNAKIGFCIKMYVPMLRANTYVLPTRLLPTAFYTEGHFSKATLKEVQTFWRRYRSI